MGACPHAPSTDNPLKVHKFPPQNHKYRHRAPIPVASEAQKARRRTTPPEVAERQSRRMPNNRDLESFVANSFRSVWALDLLAFLVEHPDTAFGAEELIAALRASEAVVSQSAANLSAVGLAIVDAEGRIQLHESGDREARLVREAIDFYRRSPDKVRRLIVAQSAPGVTAFADAFKLRRD